MSSATRIRQLQKRLAEVSARIRSLEGRHLNRRKSLHNEPQPNAAATEALCALLAEDLKPPHRKALLGREEQLRQQALAYFQKSKVDPKLWKDLASS
jgi:hypothetical protein